MKIADFLERKGELKVTRYDRLSEQKEIFFQT
jgi:hypothetical protein